MSSEQIQQYWAIKYLGTENRKESLEFLGSSGNLNVSSGNIQVTTTVGILIPEPGDYIIKLAEGDFSICKSDIFEEDYEEVTEKDMEEPWFLT